MSDVDTPKNPTSSNRGSRGQIWFAIGVVVLILVFSWIGKVADNADGPRYPPHVVRIVRSLVDESLTFHSKARQDTHPVETLADLQKALDSARIARQLVPDPSRLRRLTKVNVDELIYDLEARCRDARKRMNNLLAPVR